MPAKKSGPEKAKVRVKIRFPASRLALLDANCKILCMSRDEYFDHLVDLDPVDLVRHQLAENGSKEKVTEFTLQLPDVRLALVDANAKRLGFTRNRYVDRLLDLAPLALDRHKTAEDIAALYWQLWQIQQLERDGRLDGDHAKAVLKIIASLAREITRKLRSGE